jgi:hypothetical protein
VPGTFKVELSLEEAVSEQYARVGNRAANAILRQLRRENSTPNKRWFTREFVDLTDISPLQWRGYLSHLHNREQIIGPGVIRFLFAFLPRCNDPNHNGQPRTDFIVIQVDGTAVRLHPECIGKAVVPIFGRLGTWQGTTPATSGVAWRTEELIPTVSPAAPDTLTIARCAAIAQYDGVGKAQARAFLETVGRGMAQQECDLTDGTMFDWQRFLSNTNPRVRAQILGPSGAVGFAIRRTGDRLLYVVTRADGTRVSLSVHRKVEILWGS